MTSHDCLSPHRVSARLGSIPHYLTPKTLVFPCDTAGNNWGNWGRSKEKLSVSAEPRTDISLGLCSSFLERAKLTDLFGDLPSSFLERSGINKFNHLLKGNKEPLLLAELGFLERLF